MPKLLSEFRMEYGKCISEHLKAEGLNDFETSYGLIIRSLALNGQLTMKELAKSIARDKSTVTVLVRNLEKKNYVKRINNPDDFRSKYIVLTDKSKDISQKLDCIGSHVNDQLWDGIGELETKQFLETLAKITENVKKHN